MVLLQAAALIYGNKKNRKIFALGEEVYNIVKFKKLPNIEHR